MKSLLSILLTISITSVISQDLKGAWINTSNENGKTITTVAILTDGYQVATTYDLDNKEFISTNGGTWSYNNGVLSETVEFDTRDTSRVGSTFEFNIEVRPEFDMPDWEGLELSQPAREISDEAVKERTSSSTTPARRCATSVSQR